MTNDITINPDEIRKLADGTITDREMIRQIGLYSCKTGDDSLNSKIMRGLEFVGLYPHVITKHDILPEHYTEMKETDTFETKRKLVMIRKFIRDARARGYDI